MIVETYQKVVSSAAAQSELRGWGGIAIGSLAIAGIFAVLLAVSRIPGIENLPWPIDFFHKGLVIHVVFSFVVWFLAVLGALFQLATLRLSGGQPVLEGFGRIGIWLGWASCVLLFVPAFLDRGEASLNNYIPVIIDPLYYAGLAILAVGLFLTAVRLLVNAAQRVCPIDTVSLAAISSAVIYLLALIGFFFGWYLPRHEAVSGAFNEDLFWGGGHILQFANTTLLLSAWYVLGAIAFSRPLVSERSHRTATFLLLIFALLGPSFYGAFEAFSQEQRQAFTDLQYGLGPSALLLALGSVAGLMGQPGEKFRLKDPAFLCLMLSMVTFGVGGSLGFFVDGLDTRTPGHYHGMIGGIGLAYMGLFYALFLPLLKRPLERGKALYWQIWLYAVGQILQCLGLFLAGGEGTARKTAGAAQDLSSLTEKIGMGLNGLGGLTAVIGGVMFIWCVGKALLGKERAH